MKTYLYIICFLSLIMTACSSDDIIDGDDGNVDNGRIELSFQITNFVKGSLKPSTETGSADEQTIKNLYIFLFPTASSQILKSYYISAPTFTGGSWNSVDNKVLLNLTQAEAGNRDVYVIANCSPVLEILLSRVSTIEELRLVLQSSDTPWSPTLTVPILMSGNKTHNFNSNYQLNTISLIRALSKVQLNVKLSASHQETPISAEGTTQYKYKLINFEKNTYVLESISKISDLVSLSTWVDWSDQVTSFTLNDSGKVTHLTLITYLNESDNAKTVIELSLPYIDGGFLPPPEFGDETYKLQMPSKIERNHWYVYDIEI